MIPAPDHPDTQTRYAYLERPSFDNEVPVGFTYRILEPLGDAAAPPYKIYELDERGQEFAIILNASGNEVRQELLGDRKVFEEYAIWWANYFNEPDD